MEPSRDNFDDAFAAHFPPELMKALREDPGKYFPTFAGIAKDFMRNVEVTSDPDSVETNMRCFNGMDRADVPKPPALQKEAMMQELATLRDKFAKRLLLGHNVLREYKHTIGSITQEYSNASVSQLEPIVLSEMSAEKRHPGKYLLCRIIAKSVPILATMLGVEDTDGSVSIVLVHNFPFLSQSTLAGVDIVFPLGKHLLIREPSYMLTESAQSAYIRVYSPTDVVFLEDDDPILRDVQWKSTFARKPSLPTTVDGWRLEGHTQFKEKQWLPAAICFTNALKLDSTSQIMLLNRAETYLKLGWYFSALHDVQEARRVGPIVDETLNRKAMMREIRAKYGMCLYEDVVHTAKEHADDSECKVWLSNAIKRIAEKTRGKFDWGKLYREGRGNSKKIDVAEFQGPVEVRERDGQTGALGVFVTRDVKIGEPLVVARPLDAGLPTETIHAIDRNSSAVAEPGDKQLKTQMAMIRLINRIWDDAHANAKMQCFHTGDLGNLGREPYPPVYGERRPLEHPLKPSFVIDATRIECLALTNMFSTSDEEKGGFRNAMYDLPSFFNHACVPSAYRLIMGDVMVVRALRNMKTGEEATISYIGKVPSYSSRSSRLYKSWGFSCDCTLCEADRTDGLEACQKRDELKSRVDAMADVSFHLLSNKEATKYATELKEIVACLKGTYKITGENALINRPELTETTRVLTRAMLSPRTGPVKWEDFVAANMHQLELTGIVIADKSVTSRSGAMPLDTDQSYCNSQDVQFNITLCLAIAGDYDDVRNPSRAKAWVDAAKWLFSIVAVKDVQCFVAQYGETVKERRVSAYV